MQAQALKQAIETLEAMEALEALEALDALVPREVLEAMAHGVDRPQLAPSVGAVPRAGTPAKQTSGM